MVRGWIFLFGPLLNRPKNPGIVQVGISNAVMGFKP